MGTTVPPSKWIRICPDSPKDIGGGKEQELLPQVRDSKYAEAAAPKNTQSSGKVKTKLLWILGVVWFVAPLAMSAYSLSLSHRNSLVLQHQAKAQSSTQNEAGVFHAIRGIGQLQADLNQQRNYLSAMHNTLNARIEQLLEQQQQMNGTIVDVGFSVASHLLELQRLMNDTFVDVRLSVRSDLLELERQMNITAVDVGLSMAGMNRTIAGVRSSMASELLEQRKLMNGAIADVQSSLTSDLSELERQVNSTMVDVAPTNIKTSITRRPPTATVKTSASQKRGRIIQANSHSSSSSRTGTGGRNGVAIMIVNKLLLSCGCILTMMMRTSC